MATLEEKIRRVEIGSGKYPRAGFAHIDIESQHYPCIIGDFRTMNFEDLEEILALHILEHFSRKESVEVLRQWHGWLQSGGRLIIETPDFERICQLWESGGLWADSEHLSWHAYGSQEADWAYHKDGWWKAKFEKVLPEVGFKVDFVRQNHSYIRYGPNKTRYRLPNIRVSAIKL